MYIYIYIQTRAMMELPKIIIILSTLHSLHRMCGSQKIKKNSYHEQDLYYSFVPLDLRNKQNLFSGIFYTQLSESNTYLYANNECLNTTTISEIVGQKVPSLEDYFSYWRDYEIEPLTNQKIHNSNFGRAHDIPRQEDAIKNAIMVYVLNIASGKLYVVGCHEKYQSICIVDIKFLSGFGDPCPAEYNKIGSPTGTCLKHITAKSEVTAMEAITLCQEDSRYLLRQGYIFSRFFAVNKPNLSLSGKSGPRNGAQSSKTAMFESDSSGILTSNWDGMNEFSSVDLQNKKIVENDVFCKYREIACEYSPKIPVLEMGLTLKYMVNKVDMRKKIELEVKGEMKNYENFDLSCFTDSVTYYPTIVYFTQVKRIFIDVKNDGYYWCVAITSDYQTLESNKILYIQSAEATKYVKAYLLQFPEEVKNKDINASIERTFPKATIKRKFKNNILLIHSPPPIETDDKVKILYQRNLQQCEELKRFPKADIGKVVVDEDLFSTTHYKCHGDYNVGAFWKIEKIENKTTDVHTFMTNFNEVANLINNQHTLCNNSSVDPKDFENAMHEMNSVLLLKDVNIPQTVAGNFDVIVNAVNIPVNQTYIKFIKSNIAVLVAKRQGPNPIVGIKVKAIGSEGMDDQTIHPLTEGDLLDPNLYDSNDDIVAKVPSSICHGVDGKLAFTLFKDDAAFPKENNSDWQVNSRVLSISLDNKSCFKDSDYVEIHFRPYDNRQSNKKKACAYWDFDQGNWSTTICILLPPEDLRQFDICRCYHLTHFAQIVTYVDLESEKDHKLVLSFIIYVCGTASLIGLVIIFLTGVISETRRAKLSNQLWLHLTISLLILTVSFLIISMLDFSLHTPLLCIGAGVVLHYAVLSSFSWLTLLTFMSCKKIIRVINYDSPHKLLKLCAAGWILPVLPIIVLVCIDSNSYLLHFKRGQSEMDFCYPTGPGYWLTVAVPVTFVVIVKTILFCLIINNMYVRKNVTSPDFNKNTIKKFCFTFIIFMIYGLTWTCGPFSNNIYLAYLFCFVVAAQGLLLFIFQIILNEKSRQIWLKLISSNHSQPYQLTNTISDGQHRLETQHNAAIKSLKFEITSKTDSSQPETYKCTEIKYHDHHHRSPSARHMDPVQLGKREESDRLMLTNIICKREIIAGLKRNLPK